MKKCTKCGKVGESYGKERQCKECRKEYQRRYRARNLEESRKSVRRCSDIKRFGVPREEIMKDRCELCGSTHLLSIHHKDGLGRNVDNPNNSRNNLQTLCNNCHIALHVQKWAKKHSPKWQEKVKALSGMSNRAVGRELGITHSCVGAIRKQIGYNHTPVYGRPRQKGR